MPAAAESVNVVNVVNMVPGWNSRRAHTCDPAAVVHALADHGVRLAVEGSNLRARGPLTDADRALIREHKPALLAHLTAAEPPPATPAPAPAAHCERCGSPSFWRSPGAGWRCSWCEPRPVPLPEGFEALTLPGGQWAPDRAPPIPAPVTVAGLLALHGAIVAGCRLVDVLELTDDTDLPELHDRAALEGFARALLADRRIRPLPAASPPPLARLAVELGDDVMELREYLDRTGPGRALRVRLEREPGACDRALLALRDDPAGGLLPVLARALNPDPRPGRGLPAGIPPLTGAHHEQQHHQRP